MKILLSWSSGKDSAWALHRLRQMHPGSVGGLLTTMNEAAGRVAMHAVRESLVKAQAEAAGLPLHLMRIPSPCSNDVYDEQMSAFLREAVALGYTHVAFGDLFLEDVRAYREAKMEGSGIATMFPLWGLPTGALAQEMIGGGLRAYLTCVDPRKLDAAFAGRAFDRALVAELPPGVDPCGENGEFHSFVWDGPMFSHPVGVVPGIVVERDGFVFADLVERT
ncbi:MAG: adenine nucleotide alpha hydrolase [Acidobacteriota bacterium]|nr:adenine nucleotide alpha hydrolase [Acidobacteriota bacterium]